MVSPSFLFDDFSRKEISSPEREWARRRSSGAIRGRSSNQLGHSPCHLVQAKMPLDPLASGLADFFSLGGIPQQSFEKLGVSFGFASTARHEKPTTCRD